MSNNQRVTTWQSIYAKIQTTKSFSAKAPCFSQLQSPKMFRALRSVICGVPQMVGGPMIHTSHWEFPPEMEARHGKIGH